MDFCEREAVVARVFRPRLSKSVRDSEVVVEINYGILFRFVTSGFLECCKLRPFI